MLNQNLKIKKIISGGQTGADMGGLAAGKMLHVKTGGCAADKYMTERGSNFRLRDIYGLNDYGVSYAKRTQMNVIDSTGTVVFVDDPNSAGTRLTIEMCLKFKKPCIINPSPQQLLEWAIQNHIEILNVAGNRESISPGIKERTEKIILKAFMEEKE